MVSARALKAPLDGDPFCVVVRFGDVEVGRSLDAGAKDCVSCEEDEDVKAGSSGEAMLLRGLNAKSAPGLDRGSPPARFITLCRLHSYVQLPQLWFPYSIVGEK
jgi:hypothetical protein